MDASCQVCGVITPVSDEALREHLVDFVCVGCGTPHYATRSGAGVLSREKRSRVSVTPPARSSRSPETSADERLQDLLGLAEQSLASRRAPRAERRLELDAPDSVRATIQVADSILPISFSTATPVPETRAPEARARSLRASPVLGLLAGAAIAAGSVFLIGQIIWRAPAAADTRAPAAAPPAPAFEAAAAPTAEPLPAVDEGAAAGAALPEEPKAGPARKKRARAADPSSTARAAGATEASAATPAEASPAEGAPADPTPAEKAPPASPSPPPPASLSDAIASAVGAGDARLAPAPSAAAADDDGGFDRAAAAAALRNIAASASSCKSSPEDAGRGAISVTFLPSGAVSVAIVDGPRFSGTPTGACIARLFRGARVPPFAGPPVVVHRSFTVR